MMKNNSNLPKLAQFSVVKNHLPKLAPLAPKFPKLGRKHNLRNDIVRAKAHAAALIDQLQGLDTQYAGFSGKITAIFLKAMRQGQGPPGLKAPDLEVLAEQLQDLEFGSVTVPLNKKDEPNAALKLAAYTEEIQFSLELNFFQGNGKETLYLTILGEEHIDHEGKRIGARYEFYEVFTSKGIDPSLGQRVTDLAPHTQNAA